MLVLIKRELWEKRCMKNGEFHHLWAISATCTGTGAEQVRYSPPEPNLYRYRCGTGAV